MSCSICFNSCSCGCYCGCFKAVEVASAVAVMVTVVIHAVLLDTAAVFAKVIVVAADVVTAMVATEMPF